MAKYLFIENFESKGKIGISLNAIDTLVSLSLQKVKGIDLSCNETKKRNKKIKLHKPVSTTVSKGILHVSLFIDVAKEESIQNVCKTINEEVSNALLASTEQIPFDVQVKVMSLY